MAATCWAAIPALKPVHDSGRVFTARYCLDFRLSDGYLAL